MRSIKFDQLGRKAPVVAPPDKTAAAAPVMTAPQPEVDPTRPQNRIGRPGSENDASVVAGSPKP